jgi:hypothetical protein
MEKAMTLDGKLSFDRSPHHDYSEPGTYHLVLPVRKDSPSLGEYREGVLRLNAYGEEFLDFIGTAQHRQPHVRVDAMNILPMAVILVVTIVSRRNIIRRVAMRMLERLYRRRTMMIPMFVGQLKMSSARRINLLRGVRDRSYWRTGYMDRVVYDEAEIAELIEEVGREFLHVGLSEESCARMVADAEAIEHVLSAIVNGGADQLLERPLDSMLLGRAFVMKSRLLRPLVKDEPLIVARMQGASKGGAGGPYFGCIGPGEVFIGKSRGRL